MEGEAVVGRLMEFLVKMLKGLLGPSGEKRFPRNPDTKTALPSGKAAGPLPSDDLSIPKRAGNGIPKMLNPVYYRNKLQVEMMLPQFEADKFTWCNKWVRHVCKWFQYDGFETPETDQAGEMVSLMKSSPRTWRQIRDFRVAAALAAQGNLLVAGWKDPNPKVGSTGHVAIIAPEGVEKMMYSPSWKKVVPIIANVGKRRFYGPMSTGFAEEPEIWLYLG